MIKVRHWGPLLILLLAALYYTATMLSSKKIGNEEHTGPHSASLNEDVYSVQLPNGLRLLVEPDHSSPVVSVQAWVGCGSITENEYLGAGISHILEHMLFKGTAKRGNSEIAHTIQGVGGSTNAYTSFDRTVFYTDLPSTGWKTALDVLSDAMFNSTLPIEEYDKEQEVIRREFAMGKDDPERELQKLLFETAFTVHPYRYPVIGHLEIYNRLTREDVLKYYKRNYIPDNITFVIVGDVDPKEVEQELKKLTTSVKRTSKAEIFIPAEPRQLAPRESHVSFPTDTTRLAISFHIPGITHHDVYALDLLSVIAGQGNSSRLQQTLVEKKQLLRSVGAFTYTPAESGLFAVMATFLPDKNGNRDQIVEEIKSILSQFATTHVTPQELEKAKRQAVVSRASELKTVAGKAASLGTGWSIARDVHFGETYLDELQKVTAADIQRVAKAYFTGDNMTVVSLDPATQGSEKKAELPAASTNRSVSTDSLSTGSPIVMVADKKVPLVTVRVVGIGGLLSEGVSNNGVSNLTSRLLGLSTQSRTAEEIATEIENLGGSFESESGNNSFTLAIEVLDKDVDRAVELLADMVLNPAFKEDEILKEKTKMLADLKLELDNPLRIGMRKFKKLLFNSHPYSRNPNGTEESIQSLKREDLVAFHKRTVVSGNLVFSVAGSFEPQKTKDLFDRYFAKLPKGEKLPRNLQSDPPKSPALENITSNKQQAIVEIGVPTIAMDHPDRAALEILDEALSDLGSRLFIRIRERQSLAYFVSSSQIMGLDPGAFFIYAGVKADNADKAYSEMLDELRLIAKSGLTKDEVERARAKLLGQRLLQDQSAGVRGYKGSLNTLYGLGIDFDAKLNEKIRDISTEEVNRTVAKYLNQPNYVSVIVRPAK